MGELLLPAHELEPVRLELLSGYGDRTFAGAFTGVRSTMRFALLFRGELGGVASSLFVWRRDPTRGTSITRNRETDGYPAKSTCTKVEI
jgi:hypothetical protein